MSHASKTSHGTSHSRRRGSRDHKDSHAAQIRAQRAKAAGMDASEGDFSDGGHILPEKTKRRKKKKRKSSLDSTAAGTPAFRKVENIKIDGWD